MTTPTDTARLREDLAWIARHPYNNRAKYTAVNSLPALLDEVDRLREALKRIEFLSTNHGGWFETDPIGSYFQLGKIARLALQPKP